MTENDQQNNEETQEEVYNIVTELRNATGELPGFAWAVIVAVLLLGLILVVQSNDALDVDGEPAENAPMAVIAPADETAETDTEPVRDPDAPVSVISPADEAADTEPETDPDAPVSVISPAETEEVEAAATEEAEAVATEEPAATDTPEPTTAPEPTEVPAETEETADANMESEVEALQARVEDLEEEIIAFQADATTRALQMESLRATVTAATSDD